MTINKKSTTAFLLAVLMIFNILPLSVFANNTETQTMTASLTSASGMPGDTVEVKVELANNPGISSMKLFVEYDENLELTEVIFDERFGVYVSAPTPYSNPQVLNLMSPLADISVSGTYATLKFKISENAPDNYKAKIELSYDPDNLFNGNFEPIEFTTQGTSINIYHGIPGDINNDKQVTNLDAILLFRYSSGQDVSALIDESAIDVNADGKANNMDAILIFRFVSEWPGIVLSRGGVHTHNITKVEAKEASCTVDGNIEHYTCDSCHKLFSDANGKTEIKAEDIVIKAGHTPDEAVRENEISGNCETKSIYDEVVYCLVCQNEISRIEKTGNYGDHSPKPAVRENETVGNCETKSTYYEVVYCSICEGELSREEKTGDFGEHTPKSAVKENEVVSTCKSEGSYDEVVYCSVCDEEISREGKKLPLAQHIPGDNATCTEDQTCKVCGEVLETANGHIPGTEATCVVPQTCTVCNTIIVEATGEHKETTVPGVDATYTSKGLTDGKKCSACNQTLKEQEEIDYLKRSVVFKNTKSSEGNQTIYYYQFDGVLDLPELSDVNGYSFDGWYTKSNGGELVDYIPREIPFGYDVLYAHWSPTEYTILYEDAPKNSNSSTYTIEQEILLLDPEWPGLTFSHWTDQEGNVVEKIEKGTTGTLVLQAHYKSRKNIVIQSANEDIISLYDEKKGQYHFIYKLGTISNILLKEYQPYIHNTPAEYNYTVSESVTIEETIANSVAKTIGMSITSTDEWSNSVEWAKTHSEQNETGIVVCPEIEMLGVKAKLFEYSDSTTVFDEESLTETSVVCKSDSVTSETSSEINSTISYSDGYTKTVEKSWKIDPNLVPYGKYTIASVCDANVFAIVTYEPKKSNYYLDTFTIINSIGDTMLYDPSGYSDVDIVENKGLDFKIPKETIESTVESSYYVDYNANGGTGNMFMSVHTVNGNEKLSKNLFTKPGYTFVGWKCTTDNGVIVYEDSATVKNLADSGEIVTLYAQWELIPYTVNWNIPANASITVKRTSSPNANASTGILSSGAAVYYGDVLSITYTANAGYTLSSKGSTSITVTGNITSSHICASATAHKYTVTYNFNTSAIKTTPSCSSTSKSVTYNSTYGTLPTPTAPYYTFDGWYTAASGGTKITSSTTVATTSNHTLYAHWVQTYTEYTYINNRAGLEAIKNNLSGKYMLVSNIDLSTSSWNMLGTFKGVLNGNNHTISGLNYSAVLSDKNGRYGMFYETNGATVSNIKFTNVSIFTDNDTGTEHHRVGTLTAYASASTITNVTVSGSVKFDGSYGGKISIGGLIGEASKSTISNCTNSSKVLGAKGDARVGGIAGVSYGSSFVNCSNSGSIEAHGMVAFGYAKACGILGWDADDATKLTGCSSTGSLKAWGDLCSCGTKDIYIS